MAITKTARLVELQKNCSALLDIVIVIWNCSDAISQFGCLELLEQLVLLKCPQASLCVYESEYTGSSFPKALDDEGSNFLSGLESWFNEPEGSDEALWSDTQQASIRPILFIAQSFGGLVVEKALLQAKSQERVPSVAARTYGMMFFGTPHFSDVDWSEADHLSLDHRRRPKLSSDFGNDIAKVTSEFMQVFSHLYTVMRLCQDDCHQRAGANVLYQDDCLWSTLSQFPMSQTVENHYIIPNNSSAEHSRKNLERALTWMSEAAVRRRRNICLGQTYERSLRHTYSKEKLPETCRWLIQEENYRRWRLVPGPACLWIRGQPGAGKTMICSFIVDCLLEEEQELDVAFFFVSTEDFGGMDTALYVLDSLIYQLVRKGRLTATLSKLVSIQKSVEMLESPVTADAFRQYLAIVLETVEPQARLVVALDGLQNDEWIKNAVIDKILEANILRNISNHIKCVVTSSAPHSVILHHDQIVSIGMDYQVGVQRDIFLFAKARLAFHPQPTTQDGTILETRARQLCQRANGSFLWVQMVTEIHGPNGQMEEVLKDINTLPSSIQGLYTRMLQEVSATRSTTAQNVFCWLLAASRPLKLGELLEALIIEPDWQRGNMNEAYAMEKLGLQVPEIEIPQMCGGLVKVTKDNHVTLVHYTVRQYLLSRNNPKSTQSNLLQAHKLLAKTCILLLEPGNRTIPVHAFVDSRPYECEGAGPGSTLLDYANVNWSTHYRIAESHDQMLAGLLQSSLTKTLDYTYCRSMFENEQHFQVSNTALRICASQGFLCLTQIYLEMGTCPDGGSCTSCKTPLHLAATRGHAGVVEILLKNGASVFSTHTRGETALHLAAAHGSLKTIELLLNNDAEVNAADSVSGQTPLHAAAAFGHLDHVKLLMDCDVDVNAALPQTRETPLHLAVLGGHLQVVRYMLGGVRASSEEFALYDTIVHKPYFQTWSENFLTDYDNSENTKFDVELRYDAQEDMRKMFSYSKKYADINMSTREGWTALHLAAIKGHDAVLQVLIDKGADLAAKGNDQCTPLELAAENGHLSIVKHLIAAGADLNANADRLGPMLRRMTKKGHHDIADLLMWKIFSTEIAGGTRKWPLLYIAALSRQHTVRNAINRMRYKNTLNKLPLRTTSQF